MHVVRLAGWPVGTYVIYVIHLAIAVPMLVIEVPFGKWSHLFYRPLAVFLTLVREKASKASFVDTEEIKAEVGEIFMECMQCGTCTSLCPLASYSPRRILRQLSLDSGTEQTIDQAVWNCVTCNTCGTNCPRSIDIIDVMRAVRKTIVESENIPDRFAPPLNSLKNDGNPWGGFRENRMEWADGLDIDPFTPGNEYCLFTCCTTAYGTISAQQNIKASQALPRLMKYADVSFGALGIDESCCGDPAHKLGNNEIYSKLYEKNTDLFLRSGVQKILTTSPHCLNTFKKYYPALKGSVVSEHYTELLDRLIIEGRLIPAFEIESTVAYHDPCYLGRHNGIYEEPRRILRSIPGLRLLEMSNNRDRSVCCGGGGGGAWNSYPVEESPGVLRVREGLETGADIIATACPFCIRMLNDAVNTLGVEDQIVVRDISELLLKSVEMIKETNMAAKVDLGVDQEVLHV